MKKAPTRAGVIVKDDSLHPLLQPDDIVMLDTTIPPYHGCFVVANTKYGMVMRQYLQQGDRAILRSLNPAIPDTLFKKSKLIGVVTDVIKK